MKSLILLSLLLANLSFAQSNENITTDEALDLIQDESVIILDVRTAKEFIRGHIKNSFNLDYYADDFAQQLDLLNKDDTYLIYCRSGGRSGSALKIMKHLGFSNVKNMLGGMNKWMAEDKPVIQ